MLIYEDPFLLAYCLALFAFGGMLMGSFLNCAAWRIANGESFIKGRSHCTSCGHMLGAKDLVPVFSWLFQKGRCRYCGAKVSVRYPLTELFMGAMSVACLLRFDLSPVCIRNLIFGCCLFCLSLVDLECYEIPDGCHIISILAWAATLPFATDPLSALKAGLIGAFAIGGGVYVIVMIFDKIKGRETMGGGDIKLFFVVGLYLGLVSSLFMLILSCFIGLIFAAVGKKNENKEIPFGPSIAMAAWIMLLFGNTFVNWYLNFLL